MDQKGQSDRVADDEVVSASANNVNSRLAELDALYETSSVGLAFLDTNLRCVRVNEVLAKISGVPAEQMVGRLIQEVLPLEIVEMLEPAYRRVLHTGMPSPQITVSGTTQARPEEERAWVVIHHPVRDTAGILIGVQTVVLDVTDLERAEHLLVESDQRFRLLVEAIQDYAIYMLDTEGRVATWNSSAERMKGYTAEEVVGRSFSLFYTPEDRKRGKSKHDLALAKAKGRFSDEGWYCRKDGSRFYANVVITAIYDRKGKHQGFAKVTRDVTERARMQAEARQHSLVMETANRVALDILSQDTGVEALRHIAEAARTLSGARYAALGVARTDGEGLQEFITAGMTPREEAAIGARPEGRGVLNFMLSCSEPVHIRVLADHPASVGFPPNHPPMKSFLGVPIRRGDFTLGSLYLTNKEGADDFTEADQEAVVALAAHAAVAIHHLHLISRQRALLSGLINAQEEERRAVAYDLHDGLTQYVMAAHAHLDVFRTMLPPGIAGAENARNELAKGLHYLKEAVLESRRLVNGLRALALDDLGLAGALEQLLNEEKARAGWQEAYLAHNIAGRRFDGALETTIYRVAQEALTNARKHADAVRVRVSLIYMESGPNGPPQLSLEVRDWGKGFVPGNRVSLEGASGFGLHGMIERIHLMGGRHELVSTPGEGTNVKATFSVNEPRLPTAKPAENGEVDR